MDAVEAFQVEFGSSDEETNFKYFNESFHPNILNFQERTKKPTDKKNAIYIKQKKCLFNNLEALRKILIKDYSLNTILNMENIAKVIFYDLIKNLLGCFEYLSLCHCNLQYHNIKLNDELKPLISNFSFMIKIDNGEYTLNNSKRKKLYLAPEILNSDNVLSKRNITKADIYSIALCIIYFVTGENLFSAKDITETVDFLSSEELYYILENDLGQFLKKQLISKELTDFLSKCLVFNEDKRLSVNDCINHPWFQKNSNISSTSQKKLINELKFSESLDIDQYVKYICLNPQQYPKKPEPKLNNCINTNQIKTNTNKTKFFKKVKILSPH